MSALILCIFFLFYPSPNSTLVPLVLYIIKFELRCCKCVISFILSGILRCSLCLFCRRLAGFRLWIVSGKLPQHTVSLRDKWWHFHSFHVFVAPTLEEYDGSEASLNETATTITVLLKPAQAKGAPIRCVFVSSVSSYPPDVIRLPLCAVMSCCWWHYRSRILINPHSPSVFVSFSCSIFLSTLAQRSLFDLSRAWLFLLLSLLCVTSGLENTQLSLWQTHSCTTLWWRRRRDLFTHCLNSVK